MQYLYYNARKLIISFENLKFSNQRKYLVVSIIDKKSILIGPNFACVTEESQ